MTSSAPMTKETRIYLALWRKAYRERKAGQPIILNASCFSSALTIRSGMYRAIRPYRSGESFDAELTAASEAFVVSVEKTGQNSDPHQIMIKPRTSLSELEAELALLGITEADLLLPEEAAMQQSVQTAVAQKPGRSNPFYTREG